MTKKIETLAIRAERIRPVVANRAPANNAKGVAKSWTDSTIRAKRSNRAKVSVNGTEYGSTAKAFAVLYPNATVSEHQRFRAALIQKGQLKDDKGRVWTAITNVKAA